MEKRKLEINEVSTQKRMASRIGVINSTEQLPDASEVKDRDTVDASLLRNKRLFGNLMGHLGSAKSTLQRDNEKIEQQTALNKAAIERNLKESVRLLELQRQRERCRKERERVTKCIEDLKCQLEEVYRRRAALRRLRPLQSILVTKTLPKLAWQPSTHSKVTSELLEVQQLAYQIETSEEDKSDLSEILEIEGLITQQSQNLLGLVTASGIGQDSASATSYTPDSCHGSKCDSSVCEEVDGDNLLAAIGN